MRKTLLISLLLLAAVNTPAQKQETWQEVAPANEEFVVFMPARERTVTRLLPFAETLNLASPVYEVSTDALHFMVVSFEKREREGQAALLKTFDGFARGFEHAVRQSRRRDGNTLESEEDFTLRGMKIRPYRVRMSGREGVARLYEAPGHFYAVVVLGATYGDAGVDRFLKSFKVKSGEPEPKRPVNPDDVNGLTTMVTPRPVDSRPQPAVPDEPWPIYRTAGAPRASIAGGVLDGKAISKPQPEYPPIALAARASGRVTVQVTIDEEGKVISARVAGGHPLLHRAAVGAAYKARFSPVRLSGQPVKVSGVLTYNFVLPPVSSHPQT